jgi:hypothetical protein
VGAGGLLVELVLLKHYDSAWQWSPLALLGATLGAGAAVAWRPSRRTVAVFRGAMVLCVLLGIAGLVLHFKGNVEWALERDPSLGGLPLLWKVLRGATPPLAPAALTQLGVLGLLYTYEHPALRGRGSPQPEMT